MSLGQLKLNISTKLAVVAIALVFPIVTLLYLLVQEKNIAIDFSTKEYYGDMYLRPLRRIQEQLGQQKVMVQRNKLMGERNDLSAVQSALDSGIKDLESVESSNGPDKGFKESGALIAKFKKNWETLKSQANSLPLAQNIKAHDELMAEFRALYVHIGDYSNLILDPDLDSYYMMDVTLIKFPNLMDNFYQMQLLVEKVLAKKQMTADEKTQLTVLAGLVNADITALRTDHDVTYKNTKDESIKPALEPNVVSSQMAFKTVMNFVDQNLLSANDVKVSLAQFSPMAQNAAQKAFAMFDTTIDGEDKLISSRVGRLESNRNFTVTWVSVLTLLILALGAYFILGIIRNINRLKEAAHDVSSGKLDTQVAVATNDELGELGHSFNGMVASIRESNERAEAQNQLIDEDRVRLQGIVEEITSEISSIKQNAEIVTDNARIVAETATEASGISSEGEEAVQESISGVERIKEQIESVASKILELSSQTQAIGNIISTVDDIAKQSKFLAFNASIEASKVGEYGKGFAIVANEIKNLSEESKEATKKIGEILSEIQGLTNTSVMLAEDATKLADSGYQLSTTAGETINKLTFSIQNSAEAAFQITSSAMEQQSSLEQLVTTLQKTLATSGR